MSERDLRKKIDSIISSGINPNEIMYESGMLILEEIIPKIEAVLHKPYEISREESEVIFRGTLGRNSPPGVFLALKYNGKDIEKTDKEIIRGFESMSDKIVPVIRNINANYGIPIAIRSMGHTFH